MHEQIMGLNLESEKARPRGGAVSLPVMMTVLLFGLPREGRCAWQPGSGGGIGERFGVAGK